MEQQQFKDTVTPLLRAHVGVLVIEAEGNGPKPNEPHMTYKIISTADGIGRPQETHVVSAEGVHIKQEKEQRYTISINAYHTDRDAAHLMADAARSWFDFHGYETLSRLNLVVKNIGNITNRDALFIEQYECREGFDVTVNTIRTQTKAVDWFDKVRGFTHFDDERSNNND